MLCYVYVIFYNCTQDYKNILYTCYVMCMLSFIIVLKTIRTYYTHELPMYIPTCDLSDSKPG